MRAGGHYQFDNSLSFSFEAEKDNLNPLLLKTAVEFMPAGKVALRFGASGEPFYYTAGLGYLLENIKINIAFSYHGSLGVTPSVSTEIIL